MIEEAANGADAPVASGQPVMRIQAGDFTVEVFRQAPAGWDEAISRFAPRVPTVLATTWWAEYMQRAVYARSWYLRVDDATGTAVGLLLAFSEYPLSRTTYAWRSARPVAALGHAVFPVLGWPCGPVILDAAREVEVHQALAVAVAALQERCGLPLVNRAPVRPLDQANLAAIEAVWRAAGFGVEPAATLIVDLSPSLEELRAGLERSARKSLRKCEEKEVRVRRVGEPDGPGLEGYLDAAGVYKEAWSRGPRERVVNRLMWQILGAHGAIELFLAERNGEPLAGLGLWHHAGYGHEFAAWTAPKAHAEALPAGDALKWAIIEWGKGHGMRYYDLAGVAVAPRSGSKEEGIRRFKEKWGGGWCPLVLATRSGGGPRPALFLWVKALMRLHKGTR